jgi:hypothetical protein
LLQLSIAQGHAVNLTPAKDNKTERDEAIVARIMAVVRTMVATERADNASSELSSGGYLRPRLWCEHLADSPTWFAWSKVRISGQSEAPMAGVPPCSRLRSQQDL